MPRTHYLELLPLLLLGAVAACSKGPAFGSDNAIVAVIDPRVRETLEPRVREALERNVYTTRPEHVFEVTVTTPAQIGDFRKWARLVVIEPQDGATLVPGLVGDVEGPVFARVEDEWARDQTIWVITAATPEATVELASTRLDSVYRDFHTAWVEHQVERMWASDADSAGAQRMIEELGFALVMPKVYRSGSGSAPPDTRTWYNEDPRRVVSVHWEPASAELTQEHVLEVRQTWGRDLFEGDEIAADSLEPALLQASRTTLAGLPAVRLQGVWENPSDLTAGLFLTYGVVCGDRLVLLDGNLYAPERDKYAFLIQFERIFQTFRCGARGA
jgi:hypothetical protein